MKRWWNLPPQRPVAGTRRRAGRALMRVVVAGAVSLPIAKPDSVYCRYISPGNYDCEIVVPRQTLPRTGGAVIQAWAIGTLSGATHPNSQESCDFDHVCTLAIAADGGAGTGTGATIKTSFQAPSQIEPPSNLPFGLTETIDYGHPVTKGVHGANGGGA